MPESEALKLLERVEAEFGTKHRNIRGIFLEHYEAVRGLVHPKTETSEGRQLLVGASPTMEYAVESAALLNPSMVPARNQSDLPEGSTRFAMSLRATVEGHVSSIVFLRGMIDKNLRHLRRRAKSIHTSPKGDNAATPERGVARESDCGGRAPANPPVKILSGLSEEFTIEELGKALESGRNEFESASGLRRDKGKPPCGGSWKL